jgi:undecaprenyl-diphosphatase
VIFAVGRGLDGVGAGNGPGVPEALAGPVRPADSSTEPVPPWDGAEPVRADGLVGDEPPVDPASSVEPSPDGHPQRHVAAAAAVLISGYLFIATLLVSVGLVLNRFLLSGPVGRADDGITSWLADHRSADLNRLTLVLSRSADTFSVVGAAIVIVAVLAIGRHWRPIVILVVALATELACFLTVNAIVDRPRPHVAALGSVPSTSSFPSGHTAATLVVYASLAIFVSLGTRSVVARVLATTAAVVMPLAVAFSRVYRGMHHPLDVVAGLVMGILVLAVVLAASAAAEAGVHPSRPGDPEGSS